MRERGAQGFDVRPLRFVIPGECFQKLAGFLDPAALAKQFRELADRLQEAGGTLGGQAVGLLSFGHVILIREQIGLSRGHLGVGFPGLGVGGCLGVRSEALNGVAPVAQGLSGDVRGERRLSVLPAEFQNRTQRRGPGIGRRQGKGFLQRKRNLRVLLTKHLQQPIVDRHDRDLPGHLDAIVHHLHIFAGTELLGLIRERLIMLEASARILDIIPEGLGGIFTGEGRDTVAVEETDVIQVGAVRQRVLGEDNVVLAF